MASWKRYLTAWSRHHRSGGFGIHSPYAYRFVRHVWRQPLPYYAYDGIRQLLDTIKGATTAAQRRDMDLIDEREARLLFRVTNFFNPQCLLQVGAATGVESVAMMEVNRHSRLYLYDPQLEQKALAVRVLQTQLERVACYDDIEVAADDFLAGGEKSSIALVNTAVDAGVLGRLLEAQCVLILRNLGRDEAMSALFDTCCALMPMGQTYSNGKIAILNSDPKLQREDFSLWL
ncbi:MAG: hypothetical protein IJV11_12330 [Muribaculaceae bacterium]|nr:hypothetical protein [Muribaculaceae bacterium]